jgi:hypothetical protein
MLWPPCCQTHFDTDAHALSASHTKKTCSFTHTFLSHACCPTIKIINTNRCIHAHPTTYWSRPSALQGASCSTPQAQAARCRGPPVYMHACMYVSLVHKQRDALLKLYVSMYVCMYVVVHEFSGTYSSVSSPSYGVVLQSCHVCSCAYAYKYE